MSDASLFVYGTHSKKRPHNIVIGRLYDYHILDMFEFGVTNYIPIRAFDQKAQASYGSKPCFVVIGPEFLAEPKFSIAANLIVDFYRGEVVSCINLVGLDHVIALAVGEKKDSILFRHYKIHMRKSGSHVPKVELQEIGPSIDFIFRREHLSSPDLRKEAMRQPKQLQQKKHKNIKTNAMKDTVGTVHVHAQDVDTMTPGLVKPKALKTRGKRKRDEYASSSNVGESSATEPELSAEGKARKPKLN
eukprot:TRINITY_DN2643_c0_g2_i1.p1 TRINITY_DN2643_c0_g2~~TRINITY_DN2643_c0_g2_i1.p1  ORF type:complete len:246 (-),score=26.23 TRINITY_DN2643_c0_g2_i1:116-853(-)